MATETTAVARPVTTCFIVRTLAPSKDGIIACEPTTHAAGAQTVVGVMAVWLFLTITTTIGGELVTFISLVVTRSFLCQTMQSFTISRQYPQSI